VVVLLPFLSQNIWGSRNANLALLASAMIPLHVPLPVQRSLRQLSLWHAAYVMVQADLPYITVSLNVAHHFSWRPRLWIGRCHWREVLVSAEIRVISGTHIHAVVLRRQMFLHAWVCPIFCSPLGISQSQSVLNRLPLVGRAQARVGGRHSCFGSNLVWCHAIISPW